MLEIIDLHAEVDGKKILKGINLKVNIGEVHAIMGPNGSGKSVLFRALLGLIPYSGKIDWQPGLKISYAPQKLPARRTHQ